MERNQMNAVLAKNPRASRDRKVLREALEEIRRLRQDGVGGRGYTLTPPFGEKGAFRRIADKRRAKVTEDA